MKKISLNGITEILSEKELKNVMGGSASNCPGECSGNPCSTSYGRNGKCTMTVGTCWCREG